MRINITPSGLKMFLSVAAFAAGVTFAAIGGFVTPPPGIIDKTMLIFIAQCFVLSATFLGFKVDWDLNKQKFKAGEEEPKDKKKIKHHHHEEDDEEYES